MGVSNDGELMFSCECDEPKVGKIVRNVYSVDFSPENLQAIYNKASKFRNLMGWEIPTYEHFISFFLNPNQNNGFKARGLCARIDDFVGIFWLTDINYSYPPHSASIHYTFFDRRHKGRLNLCRAAIKYIFELYGFERLWTQVPLYMYQPYQREGKKNDRLSVMGFVEQIGFRKEGRMKNAMMYRGQKFDANMYALTKEEVLIEDVFSKIDKQEREKWVPETQIINQK